MGYLLYLIVPISIAFVYQILVTIGQVPTILNLSHTIVFGNIENLKSDDKPSIFGLTLCGRSVKVDDTFNNYLNALHGGKMALSGVYDGRRVFLKKLGDDFEFRKAERKMDKHIKYWPKSSPDFQLQYLIQDIGKSLIKIDGKLILCPNETSLDVKTFIETINQGKIKNFKKLMYIWTSIEVNPEAAMLQILQPSLWPVPRYFGACGQYIIVEDCGKSITSYYYDTFEKRARIASKLLRLAIKMTKFHDKYAFYFTDLSPDNIVVDKNGNLRLIDLENVIIVDKKPTDINNYPDWNDVYTVHDKQCDGCYAFRPHELCTHAITDQNILSVCKEILYVTSQILDDGLLYDPPQELNFMLHDCIHSHDGEPRFVVANKLINYLESVYQM